MGGGLLMTASPAPAGPASGSGSFDNAPLAATAIWDDFDGPWGTKPNSALWTLDTINQGGIQAYSTDNVYLDGAGHLVLKATKPGSNYLSGRVTSRTKFNMQLGRVSASIKIPAGTGLFPAFWLLAANTPIVGEIDIIEMVDVATNYYVNLHPTPKTTMETHGQIADLSTAFHEYWLDWRKDSITIGVDQTTWGSWTPADLPAGTAWSFNTPMYVIVNLAVGGSWAKPPDATTPFPSQILIDWFRYTPW